MTLDQVIGSVERTFLCDALKTYKNQSHIAKALGISQPTVARRMKKYGLSTPLAGNG